MIAELFRELSAMGILGMNRRNAEYIMRQNPRALYPKVDNKVLTKKLALEHRVPTPDLYFVIDHHGDVAGFDKALSNHTAFALKPARGSGGNGILLIADRTPEGFAKQTGQVLSREAIAYHISSILSGIYSLGGREDSAIIEALIRPEPVFADIMYQGVPDIRVVVYRGVPVMAMTRLPTRASDGKANLHAGALGAGIDLATGTTLTAVQGSQVVTHHPDTGNPIAGIKVPYWDNILKTAAKAYEMTGLGYVGVDQVIDTDKGPVLLELNARPGLQIQVANRDGLLHRLEKVDQAAPGIFATPESRTTWARETFGA
jgi:alpha-L-glutamate ligase-like protein